MGESLPEFLQQLFGTGGRRRRRRSEDQPTKPPVAHRREQVLELEQHVSPAGRLYLTAKWGRTALLVVAPEKPGDPWTLWAKPAKAAAAGASGIDRAQFEARYPTRKAAKAAVQPAARR